MNAYHAIIGGHAAQLILAGAAEQREEPVPSAPAFQVISNAVVVHRGGVEVSGQGGGAHGIAVGRVPFGQDGLQGGEVVIVGRVAADQDVVVAVSNEVA